MNILSAGLCDIGIKRKSNQDSIKLYPEKQLFVVADGMGGHNGGDIASQMAVNTIVEYIVSRDEDTPTADTLKKAIQYANSKIKEFSSSDKQLEGMGTTAVALLFTEDTLYLGNVGDSRTYMINNKMLFQLSKDHSLVQEKLNLGLHSRVQALNDPNKNILVRTVGFEEDVEVDIFTYKINKNDIFLACSDGLYGMLPNEDILKTINDRIPNPESCGKEQLEATIKQLIDQANERGGRDNIACIMTIIQ